MLRYYICSLPATEKRFDAGMSFVIQKNYVNKRENSGLKMKYCLYAGISPDLEITTE